MHYSDLLSGFGGSASAFSDAAQSSPRGANRSRRLHVDFLRETRRPRIVFAPASERSTLCAIVARGLLNPGADLPPRCACDVFSW